MLRGNDLSSLSKFRHIRGLLFQNRCCPVEWVHTRTSGGHQRGVFYSEADPQTSLPDIGHLAPWLFSLCWGVRRDARMSDGVLTYCGVRSGICGARSNMWGSALFCRFQKF